MMNHAMMRPATMIANNCKNTSLALGKMYVKNTTIKAKAAQNKVAINGTPVAVKFLKIFGLTIMFFAISFSRAIFVSFECKIHSMLNVL